MHLLDMVLLLLVELSKVQGLLLEIVNFRLQIHDLLVLLDLELLCIDLVLEVAQLSHHHAHVPTVGIQEVLFVLGAGLLHQIVNVGHLLVDQVEGEHDALAGGQLGESLG